MDKKTLFFAGIALILAGCSYSKDHPPTEHNTACEELNQKITFPSPENNGKVDYNSQTKQAEVYHQYEKYNCENKQ